MNTFKDMGVIEQGVAGKSFRMAGINSKNGFRLIKILPKNKQVPDWVKDRFPEAETVTEIDALIHDSTIDLVMVSANDDDHKNLVADILQTGKHVRVV